MGVVYKAVHLQLKRTVALKMILAGSHAAREQLARFRAEAEAVARLRHPNIVQIYEVGADHRFPFFALEFSDGGSLDRRLASTPQPPRQAAALLEKLARAMHAAHQCGVVHRDLKPGNVLLSRRTEAGTGPAGEARPADGLLSLDAFEPKISDFGLAKRLDDPAGYTASGFIVGTPSYMAPEQAQRQQIGPAADVHALGAILYEMLTGRPPFKGETLWDTLEQVCSREPVAPRQLQPRVPRDLEIICLKCLEKEPGRRYGSALELAEDLGRFLRREPIVARPVPTWERALKWARRQPTQAALAGAVVLALLAGTAGGVFYGLYKDQQEQLLRQQVERRRAVDDLWVRGQGDEASRRLDEAARSYDRALTTLDADPGAAPEGLRSQIATRLERVCRELTEREARRQARARADQFARLRDDILFQALDPTGREPEAGRGQVRRLAPAALAVWGVSGDGPPGAATRALEGYRAHLESSRQVAEVTAGCCEVLLVWADAQAQAEPAEDAPTRQAWASKALKLLETAEELRRAHGLPTPQAFHVRRAHCLQLLGDGQAAAAERDRAARMEPRTALDHFLGGLEACRRGDFRRGATACAEALRLEPGHFWAQYLEALCHLKAGEWADARDGFTACLARRRGFLWARLFRATALARQEQFHAAEEDFAQALHEATDSLERSVVLTNRSAFWVRQQRWNEARADLKEAISLRPSAYQAHANLAQVYRGLRQWDQAIQEWTRALELHLGDARLFQLRAQTYLDCDDRRSARSDFEQVITLESRDRNFKRLASAYVELGRLEHKDRQFDAALADFDKALRLRPGYAPAYRQRAQTLLALEDHARAGEALDRYFQTGGKSDAQVEKARGLIHARRGELLEAIEAYSRALRDRRDAETLGYRGWAYLQLVALRPALADFESALRLNPAHADSLCGRGQVRLLQGQVAEGLADAEKALAQGPRTARLLFNAACLYARAAGQAKGAYRGQSFAASYQAARYEERAVALLDEALEQVPAGRRRAFWRDTVQARSALVSLRGSSGMLRLERAYSPGKQAPHRQARSASEGTQPQARSASDGTHPRPGGSPR
jgi:tetratricopeptide (TPR) repeat protein